MDDHGLKQQIEAALADLDREIHEAEQRLAALKQQHKAFRKGLKAIAPPPEDGKP